MPSIYSTKEKNWQLRLDYHVTPHTAQNQSEISCEIYIYNTGGNSNLNTNGAYYRIQASGGFDSGRVYKTYNWPDAAWHYVGKYVFTVPHNSDGTKLITLNGYWNAGHETTWTPRDLEAAATVTLPAIPRASTVSAGSFTIGEAGNVTIKAAVSSFRHRLTYKAGNHTGNIPPSGEKLSRGDVSWTPPRLLLKEVADSTSLTATIYCETFAADGTRVGKSQMPIKLYVPTDVCPTIDHVELVPVNTNKWLDQQGIYVAGYSQVLLTAGATAGEGTVLKSMSVTGFGTGNVSTGNVSRYQLSWKSPTLTAGRKVFTITANDKRPGRAGSAKRAVTPYAYTPPAITKSDVFRCNAEGQAQSDGGYIRVFCSAAITSLSGRNHLTLQMRVRPAGGAWGGYTVLTNGTAKVIPGFSAKRSYEVELTAADCLGRVKTVAYTIPTAEIALHLRPGGKGVAIGKYSEKEAFECTLCAEFTQPVRCLGGIERNILTERDDLNAITQSGFYYWGDFVIPNGPPEEWGSSGRWCELTVAGDCQEAVSLATGVRMQRRKKAGQWLAWECVNPPMEEWVEYRTTERFRGKPVYTKLVVHQNVSLSASVTNFTFAHRIQNLDAAVAIIGRVWKYQLPHILESRYTVIREVTPEYIGLSLKNDAWGNDLTWWFVVKYTKTTD